MLVLGPHQKHNTSFWLQVVQGEQLLLDALNEDPVICVLRREIFHLKFNLSYLHLNTLLKYSALRVSDENPRNRHLLSLEHISKGKKLHYFGGTDSQKSKKELPSSIEKRYSSV